MKKYYFLLAAAVATLAFSCAKEQEQEKEPLPAKDKTGKVTIVVSNPGALDTKVSLTEADDKKSMLLEWEETDALSINGEEFSIDWNSLSDDGKTAEFSGDDPGDGPYTIVYPASLSNAEGFNARSYTSQSQEGNSVTTALVYNAMLSGVDTYNNIQFNSTWATEQHGSLAQNGVIQMRLKLPNASLQPVSVKLLASSAVFPSTNSGSSEKVQEQTLALSNVTLTSKGILEAYMMFSAAGVTFTTSDVLNVIVETSDNLYYRTIEFSSLNAEQRNWVGGQQYTLQCVMNPNSFEIHNDSELEEFRDGVNSGDFLWQHKHVTLANDIDCSSIASWTPIGNGTFDNSAYTVSGNSFKGTFDGDNKVLKNFQITGTSVNAPYGLFGVLDGATVKNFSFGAAEGDNGYFKVIPNGVMAAGIVAGVARSSTIQNVTNYRPMSIEENTSSYPAYFGMVGYLLGTTDGKTVLDNVDNHGDVTADTGDNTANGATGFQVAGIAGFSHTNDSSVKNELSGCDNHGDLTTSTGRVAGILAAANTRTTFDNCVNRGNITNSGVNARIGGITVIMNTGCSMTSCSNYGNIVASDSQTNLGGLVCLLNHINITISGGGNYGMIVGDNTTYRGTIAANFNKFKSLTNVVAGGTVASYNEGSYDVDYLDNANYSAYLGANIDNDAGSSSHGDKIVSGTTFDEWGGYSDYFYLISDADELEAFRDDVNDGTFASSGKKAVLTGNIDCTSISNWTPIGNCTMPTWTYRSIETSGNLFVGYFDGRNHSLSNLSMAFSSSNSTFAAYGFFGGIGDGAIVKNLVFDDTCSMTVSASYGSTFGVLAGLVMGATISDVTNRASITGGGTESLPNSANGWLTVGGLVGDVELVATAASLKNLTNYGNIGSALQDFSRGGNAGAGGTGVHVGGIAGFSTNYYLNNASNNNRATFTSCENFGNIYTDAGRSSGILAAITRYTTLKDCINHGNMVSSFSGTARLGNITCMTNTGAELNGCINYGNLTALDCVTVAGVVGGFGAAATVTNCASLGATILGKSVNISGKQTYNGVLFGYCNNATNFSGCRVSGVFGRDEQNTVTLTADNYFQYTGQATSVCTTYNQDNITFATE